MFLLLGFAGELATAVCVSVATTLAVKAAEDWHESRKRRRKASRKGRR